ncbi:MAG TPA: MCE family protein [Actinophytocola sp.]|uniref:MCE family protein n=1 Tax=Actinophytocola sp. TaxID=1872138 RepID=UPI002DDD9743|nr:MCE family protein [Actinophytocola sp.]HEV2778074.1 MCE family protein [Actinophytocola sp.]
MARGLTRKRLAVGLAVLAVITALNLWWIFAGDNGKRITAYFSRAVGVYPGSDVQVLGVRVGAVDSVTPRGDRVEVVMTLDSDAPVSAGTRAVIVAPSVVADRHVQLTTLSGAGPKLAHGAVIPAERTATPVELDELYASLNDLLTALGPNGANADGALSDLLSTGAANLRGNGAAFNENVRNFAELARTLASSRDDLFGTIDELQTFTGMLARNDERVLEVNGQLAEVWRTLAADREELSAALHSLAGALGEIQAFIRDNRAAIKSNVDKLAETTQVLVDRRAQLAEALDVAPIAVTNLLNAFDPASQTLQGRANLLEYLPLPVAGEVYQGGAR